MRGEVLKILIAPHYAEGEPDAEYQYQHPYRHNTDDKSV